MPRFFPRDGWFCLILLFALTLRTYHLAYPPWDYHNWRQTITLMVARDFDRHGFPLLHPQVSWMRRDQPSAPSYFSAEFSIQGILAALLYTVFGESDAVARSVVIAFSLMGICALYDLLNRRAGQMAARSGAFVYALFPYHIFFGRVFMPDIPALALALAGLDALDRWTDDRQTVARKWGGLAVAAALTALAILQKLTVIFIAVPMLYLFWSAQDRQFLKRREPYFFALIAGLPALAWYAYAVSMAQRSVFTMQRDLFMQRLELWRQASFAKDVIKALAFEAFSPMGLVLVVIGFFLSARGRAASVFRLWVVSAGLLLMLMPGVLPSNHYYLSLLLPGGAALAGLCLARLRNSPILALILAVFAAGAIKDALPLYLPDRAPYDLGRLLSRLTRPDDLIATESGGSPNILYFADRRGWILWGEYELAPLEQLRRAGALYYADTFLADPMEQRPFFQILDNRFERLSTEDGPWPIYSLSASMAAPLGPQRELAREVPNSARVNFGDRIEFRGIALRRLLDWPASFEVTYYWHCLQRIEGDSRIFVHFTDSQGRTAYQQDHWPRAGRFQTSKWQANDDIVERYVVVFPATLPAGKYQIRLGWFDPVTGLRLPIVHPGNADQDDRALVAEIEIPRPPKFGWLSPLEHK